MANPKVRRKLEAAETGKIMSTDTMSVIIECLQLRFGHVQTNSNHYTTENLPPLTLASCELPHLGKASHIHVAEFCVYLS